MAESSKLEMDFPSETGDLLEDKKSGRKVTVSDKMNGFQYSSKESDSFVIEMESMSVGSNRDVTTPISRISRNLSRKGSPSIGGGNCGDEKKTNSSMMAGKGGDPVATCSPKAATVGHGTPEKPTGMSMGATDHSSSPQGHHQITITANNMNTNAENRLNLRKNSFRRHSQSWFFDPKRILILFATLSSMGTMLLIYFTLTISQPDEGNNAFD